MTKDRWTTAELELKLVEFERELVHAGLAKASVQTYIKGSDAFVRWLDGRFEPRGPNT
jgi:hypothetical protein